MRNKVILYSTITKYKLKKRKFLIHLSIICHNGTQLFLKSLKSFMNNSNLNNIYGECSVNS